MPAIPASLSTLISNAPPPAPVKSCSCPRPSEKSSTNTESDAASPETSTPFADSLTQASSLLENAPQGFPVPGLALEALFIPPVPEGDATLAHFLPMLMAQSSQAEKTIAPSDAESIQAPLLPAMIEATAMPLNIVAEAGFAESLSKAAISAASQGGAVFALPQESQSLPVATSTPPPLLSASSPPTVAPTPVVDIPAPIGTREWGNDIGNRLVWMANRQEGRAELVLNPPQMGRIEVSLTVSGSEASAQFSCASPAVKEALENAMPRLRELLADAGITLGQAQVGSHFPGRQDHEKGDNSPQGFTTFTDLEGFAAPQSTLGSPGSSPAWQSSGRGLIDIFA